MTGEERDLVRLHLTRGLGRVGLLRLIEAFGSAGAALSAAPAAWRQAAGLREALAKAVPTVTDRRFTTAVETLERLGVHLLPLWDESRYPPLLRTIHDPPALLYLRGSLPPTESLAVVGSRRASVAGRRLTEELCSGLAAHGISVVSGLARGIDTAAHRGVLDGGGVTVGVLGCGIDRVYPRENARLFDEVLEQGALLSEYPPGTEPLAGHFPARNRIISGLSRGVLVVEAAEGSGSLITVDFALDQGREVFAIPGPVRAATSGGVNRLLKEGAHLVTDLDDILGVLWPGRPAEKIRRAEKTFADRLAPKARKLYLELDEEPRHIDELTGKSGLTPMEVSTILLDLELQGGVEQLPGMHYVRARRS